MYPPAWIIKHGWNFFCAIMSIFEKFGPFVGICQYCGLMPFTVKRNLDTNKFEKFTFSFKNFNTWWFFFILVLQFLMLCSAAFLYTDLLHELSSDRTMPITVTILIGTVSFSYWGQFFTSRWIMLRYRQLKTAVEAVLEVERLLGEKFIMEHQQSSFMARSVGGLILSLMAAIGFLCFTIPAFQHLLPKTDVFTLAVIFSMGTLINVMFECQFLLIHLCYYVIAHYIKLVALYLGEEEELETFGNETRTNLKRSTLIFEHLCRTSFQLNGILSVPVLFFLTTKFISIVTCAFACIWSFLHSNETLDQFSLALPFLFVSDWIRIFIILSAVDMPISQVRLLRERVISVTHSKFSQTLTDEIEVSITLMQIDEDRIRLSAAGLFMVGVHLIPPLSGAVVTYMVILLQN